MVFVWWVLLINLLSFTQRINYSNNFNKKWGKTSAENIQQTLKVTFQYFAMYLLNLFSVTSQSEVSNYQLTTMGKS